MAFGGVEEYRGIRTVLIQNRDFFITNFEVNNTLKLIFENHIISTEEYRRISSEIDRKKKRQILYEILVNKDIGIWIKQFQEILKDTGQIYILSNTKDHIEDGINNIPFGDTTPTTDDNNVDLDVVYRLTMASSSAEATVLHEISTDQSVIRQCLENNVLDIRHGKSIYIHCRRSSSTDHNHEQLFRSLKHLLPVGKSVKIEIYKKHRSIPFDEYFGKPKTQADIKHNDSHSCFRCQRGAVLQDKISLLDQIESDIIDETFKRSTYVSEFIKNVCQYKPRPRIQRARYFLEYVLQNTNVLPIFVEVCKEKNVMKFDNYECEGCKMGGEICYTTEHIKKEPCARYTIQNEDSTSYDGRKKRCTVFTDFASHPKIQRQNCDEELVLTRKDEDKPMI